MIGEIPRLRDGADRESRASPDRPILVLATVPHQRPRRATRDADDRHGAVEPFPALSSRPDRAVLAQRLVRKLCLGLPAKVDQRGHWHPVGCQRVARWTGYKGPDRRLRELMDRRRTGIRGADPRPAAAESAESSSPRRRPGCARCARDGGERLVAGRHHLGRRSVCALTRANKSFCPPIDSRRSTARRQKRKAACSRADNTRAARASQPAGPAAGAAGRSTQVVSAGHRAAASASASQRASPSIPDRPSGGLGRASSPGLVGLGALPLEPRAQPLSPTRADGHAPARALVAHLRSEVNAGAPFLAGARWRSRNRASSTDGPTRGRRRGRRAERRARHRPRAPRPTTSRRAQGAEGAGLVGADASIPAIVSVIAGS